MLNNFLSKYLSQAQVLRPLHPNLNFESRTHIQNASSSQAKIKLRTSFLQNSFQWLLTNFSYFLKKGKKQKQFFIPPLCLIRLKSCYCIKIVKIAFIHNFEKKNFSNLSSVLLKLCNIKYRSGHQKCFIKKVFLEISQNLQKNTYARISSLKGRIHCEIFLSEHFMKYSFRVISRNIKNFHEILLL